MTERTLALLKPDATARRIVGRILTMAEDAGLRIVAARHLTLTPAEASDLYAEHAGRDYFEAQVEYMTSGPVLALVLEGEGATAKWRSVMGPTDRTKAPEGTVRRLYAETYRRNSVHGSDSPGSAAREIAILFSSDQIASPAPAAPVPGE